MNEKDFCQNPQNLIFGTFGALLTPRDSFFQKSACVTFLTLTNFMQKIRKNS